MDRLERDVVSDEAVRSGTRPPPLVRRLRALAVVLVVALVAGGIWWQTDGQQRRRAVAALGDLPGVTRVTTRDGDPRYVSVRMDDDATTSQALTAVRRAYTVTDSEKYPVVAVTVVLGSALTVVQEVDGDRLADRSSLRRLVTWMVALRTLGTGSASVSVGGFIFLRRTGNPSPPDTGSLDQVQRALRLLDEARLPLPTILYGYGMLEISQVEVPIATLSRTLAALRPLVQAGLSPKLVRPEVVNLYSDGVPRSRTRSLLQAAARGLADVRSGGRPVIKTLVAEDTGGDADPIEVAVR